MVVELILTSSELYHLLPSLSSTEYHSQYFKFTGVSSCWDVIHLHRLLWASVVLNVIGLFLGIINAAILGAYKDMVSRSQNCSSWKEGKLYFIDN